ncbi:MAG: YrhK family protein [Hydrogenovibrio sp.]|nr:YrhK family protein [Hydrogenovibrio sp.]
MRSLLRIIIQDYRWIHLSLGLFGNINFFIGSVLFLGQFEAYRTLAVWLFIVGSFFMLIGSIGQLLFYLLERTSPRSK